MARRIPLILGSFLVWTLFVWVGRIRNALGDPALDDGGRTGPLLLALSFVVPAVVLAVAWLASRRAAGSGGDSRGGVTPFVRNLATALAAWTTGVWVVRILDIALGGDHEVGFVVVHAVLAAVSIAASVAVVRAVWADREPTRSDVHALGRNAS